MSGPSEAAVRFAHEALMVSRLKGEDPDPERVVLAAAHDPALGLDRSVCLRDVVEFVRRWHPTAGRIVARFIEREFGGGS